MRQYSLAAGGGLYSRFACSFFLAFCYITIGCFSSQAASEAPIRLHHDLLITINPETHALSGSDTISIRSDRRRSISLSISPTAKVISVDIPETLNRFPEDQHDINSPEGKRKGCRKPNFGHISQKPSFHLEQGRLDIVLPENMHCTTTTLAIKYEATFNEVIPTKTANPDDPTYGITGVISNTGTFLLPESGWYPEMKGSDSRFNLTIEAPSGIEAVTSGTLVQRETKSGKAISKWEINRDPNGLPLLAGPYIVSESMALDIPIYTYFLPGSESLSENYLSACSDYLKLYSQILGPYPFSKFAVVENFFPTGYGFPSFTALGSSVIRLPFIVKTSLGHEVAHSWFGNCVLPDPGHGNWSEGLTTYIADHLFKERASEKDAQEYRMQILRDYTAAVTPESDFPLAEFNSRSDIATRIVGYGKAAMLFHMARRTAGNEAFWKALQDVVREKRFQQANWSDFAKALSHRSGLQLNKFFSQWINRTGAPVLDLTDVKREKEAEGWKISGTVRQQEPYYDLLVPVRLEAEADAVNSIVHAKSRTATFEMRIKSTPKKLMIDPDVDLFRRLHSDEMPPIINSIRGSQTLVAVVSNQLSKEIIEASAGILQDLGFGSARVVPEKELSAATASQNDLLFLGVPEDKSLLPPFPEGFSLAGTYFTVDGIRYDSENDALFAAFNYIGPGKSRTAAVFLPLSAKAALMTAKKVPHYGKYSLVIFREGLNTSKCIWPTSKSPLVHIFGAQ